MLSQQGRILESALRYVNDYGFSVVPIRRDNKKSLIPWLKYQTQLPTDGDIKMWSQQFPEMNIGIVTGEVSSTCVIDIDAYASDYNDVERKKYIPDSIFTPTCRTPRGGKHLFFRYPRYKVSNNVRKIGGCDFRGDGGYVVAAPSFNTDGSMYQWSIDPSEATMVDLPDEYSRILLVEATENVNDMFVRGRRDDDLFHVANCLAKGGMPQHEALYILQQLASLCDPPESSNKVIEKLQSAYKRNKNRRIDTISEVKEWISNQVSVFSTADIYRDLGIMEREDKKSVSKFLSGMVSDGVLKREGKAGQFSIINSDLEVIEWWKANDDEYPLELPLGVHDLVKTYPGNIIVVAGAPNAGKTAWLLNVIRMNMDKHDIHYFNSEMGASELKIRLKKFRELKRKDWNFNAYERDSNFADVIVPDGFNVIDYIEIHEEFWKVGQQIKDIHDRLRSGIAVIALQKKPGYENTMGMGASFGLQKPRLYLSMDRGRVEIVKGKNWRSEFVDPNRLSRRFSIRDGYEFQPITEWRRE